MIEEARVSLAKGKDGDDRQLLIAGVQASLAVAESLQEVESLLSELGSRVDQIDAAVMMIANASDA